MNKYLKNISWVKESYEKGIQAFIDDPKKCNCPITNQSSVLREAWLKGYCDAETLHEEHVTCRMLGIDPQHINLGNLS